jgi:hypothetical protein
MSAKVIQHNALTGETIERDATAEESAYFAEVAVEAEAEKAALKAKEKARAAVLAKLGLTADEAAALLG